MFTTPEFLKTVEEKVIRQLQPAFGDNYVAKILRKYPSYSFVYNIGNLAEF